MEGKDGSGEMERWKGKNWKEAERAKGAVLREDGPEERIVRASVCDDNMMWGHTEYHAQQ